MGFAKIRRERFFAKHPICCFCGGGTPATTVDHVPSIQVFYARQRPAGLEFPACASCNSATSNAEQIVAAFSRMYPDAATEAEAEENERVFAAAFNNAPGLIRELQPSARQSRNFLKQRNLSPIDHPPSEVPILNADGPILNAAFQAFGLKLFCALHYEHSGKIVPPQGAVGVRVFTNVEVADGKITPKLLDILGPAHTLRQGKKEVGDQFFYRFTIGEEGNIGYFVGFFREAFVIMGFIHFDGSRFPVIKGLTPLHPLKGAL